MKFASSVAAAVSKSTVPTWSRRSTGDWRVLTFWTRSIRVCWTAREMIPRWIRSRWSVIVKRTKMRRTTPTRNAIPTHARAHDDPGRVRDREPGDRAEHEARESALEVEADDRAPARMAVVDDRLAGVQVHGRPSLPPPRGPTHSAAIAAAPRSPPRVARVEPLTTARVLRGPFDYERIDGVGVGSVVRVPFGGRDVLGVVTALSRALRARADRRRAAVLEESLPRGPRRARAVGRRRVLLDARARALADAPAARRAHADGAARAAAARAGAGRAPDRAPARAARVPAAPARAATCRRCAGSRRAASSRSSRAAVRRAPEHTSASARAPAASRRR